MSRFRLAANLAFLYKERPLLERFAAARTSGFAGVELGFPYDNPIDELVQAKQNAGVEIVLISTPPGNWDNGDRGLAAIPGRQKEFRESIATAIQYATALKCQRIHTLAGTLPKGWDETVRAAYEAVYIENLQYATDHFQQNDIVLFIEPISTFPRYFLRHQHQGVNVIQKVNRPNIKLQYDIFHAQSVDGNLTSFFDDNRQYIDHIQVGQVPGRHEPDSHGEVNFPFLFNHLETTGYDKWIGCEYNPRGKTEDGLGWAASYLTN
jgi:hydroxypyruvate isomerase